MAGQTIVVSVLADTKRLSSGLKEAGGILGNLGGVALGGAKIAIGAIAGIGAAVTGLAIGGGISRALNIDTARTQLKALGYDTTQVQGIMTSALASVKGTSFGLDQAATVAANALAAGVPQGEALTSALTTVANTAALAKVDMSEMGSIFGKVWANGKVTTQEMNQLADRGVPIWSYLGKAFNVSNEELRKMIESGQVTADMFTGALGPAVAGMAGTMGQSFKGLVTNLRAALSRIGAMFAGPAIEAAKPWLIFLTEGIDALGKLLGPLSTKFSDFLGGIAPPASFADLFSNLDPSSLVTALGTAVQNGVTWITSGGLVSIFTAITSARDGILAAALEAFPGILDALVQIAPMAVQGLASLISQLVGFLAGNATSLLGAAVQMFTGLIGAVAQILPQLLTSVTAILPSLLVTLLAMIPLLLEAAVTVFTSLVEAIPVILPPLITMLVSLIPSLIETILGMIPTILDAAVSLFTSLVEALPVILPLLLEALINLVPKIITTVLDMIPKLLDAAVQLFTGIVTAIPKIVPSLIDTLINLAPQMVGAIIGLIPKLIEAGVNLIGGLIKGLWQAAGSVGEALISIAKSAIGGFLKLLGIHSPSRLFASYGKYLIQGLVGGIDGNGDLVTRSLRGLAGTVAAFDAPTLSLAPSGALTASTVRSGTGAPSAPQASTAPSQVELSPYDRRLLAEIADRIGITISERSIQTTANGGNANAAQRRAA